MPLPRSCTTACGCADTSTVDTEPAKAHREINHRDTETQRRRGFLSVSVSLWRDLSVFSDLSVCSGMLGRRSEIEAADEGLHQCTARGFVWRIPVGPPDEGEEPLLVEVFLEHVEALGDERDGLVPIRVLLE